MVLAPKLYSFLCACFAANGAALFGYDLAVISYVLPATNFLSTVGMGTGPTSPEYNESYIGFIVSSLLLGAFVGSIPASLIADRFSRRTAIVSSGIVFLLGGSLQAGAQSRGMMLAGRFFAGFSIGMLGVLAPLYQSEIAHPSNRGRLGATFQLFIGIGAFVAGWIGYGCAQAQPGTALEWRVPLALQMLPAIPLVFLTFMLPESPRWLMIKGRDQEALHTLARLHARGNINDEFVRGEFDLMRAKVLEEAAMNQSWSLIFSNRTNLRKVMYGVILQFSVQMTGVSAIQYYAAQVYTSVGFTKDALLINSINNVIGILGQVCCVLFLDRVGRRAPLIWGNVIAGTCFAICTALAKQFYFDDGNKSQGIAFVAFIYIYNFFFSSCIGPLSWVYPVEIMNTAIRAKATAITTMAAWLANFMIGQVSPIAFKNIGWHYYLVFTVCGFTNALTFYLLFPETKGRTLEDMDSYFRNHPWIVPGSKVDKIDGRRREQELAENGAAKDTLGEKMQEHRVEGV